MINKILSIVSGLGSNDASSKSQLLGINKALKAQVKDLTKQVDRLVLIQEERKQEAEEIHCLEIDNKGLETTVVLLKEKAVTIAKSLI